MKTFAIITAIIAAIAIPAWITVLVYMGVAQPCVTAQANNDWVLALAEGCSFEPLPNGEYPYQWGPAK
jgi:hypothetical protein